MNNSIKFFVSRDDDSTRLDIFLSKKIQSFAHGEFNKSSITKEDNIKSKIESGQDVLERGFKLKKVDIDTSFPKYIIDNKEKLKKWIM